jgi:hypothetical protein
MFMYPSPLPLPPIPFQTAHMRLVSTKHPIRRNHQTGESFALLGDNEPRPRPPSPFKSRTQIKERSSRDEGRWPDIESRAGATAQRWRGRAPMSRRSWRRTPVRVKHITRPHARRLVSSRPNSSHPFRLEKEAKL